MNRSQFVALATTVALSLGSFSLAGCSQQGGGQSSGATQEEAEPQYADEAFIKDLGKGLEARWKLTDELTYGSTDEEEKVMRKLVNAELDILKDYTSQSFEDSKLQEKAIQYINLLKDQLESLKYISVDYVKYEEMWGEAYNKRSQMLVDFVDNYGLTVSDDYLEDLTDMKVNASMVTDKEEKQAKVDALGEGVVFEKANDDSYDAEYVAIVENNTGFDIKNFTADVTLLDADGVIVDTQYINIGTWKNGQKAKFSIYPFGIDFVSTEIHVTWWE